MKPFTKRVDIVKTVPCTKRADRFVQSVSFRANRSAFRSNRSAFRSNRSAFRANRSASVQRAQSVRVV